MPLCSKCGSDHDAEAACPPLGVVGGELHRAGRLRRLIAAAVDLGVAALIFEVGVLLSGRMHPVIRRGTLLMALTFLPAVYLLFRDSISGRSAGKWLMGLVVWDRDAGRVAGPYESLLRNWPIALGPLVIGLGSLFPPVAFGGAMILAGISLLIAAQISLGMRRRLGDEMSDTQVIDGHVAPGVPALDQTRRIETVAKPRSSMAIAIVVVIVFAVGVVGAALLGPFIGLWQQLQRWQQDLESAGIPSRVAFGFVTIVGIPFLLASLRLVSKNHSLLPKWWPKSAFVSLAIILFYGGGMSFIVWGLTAGSLLGKRYCPFDLAVFESGDTCRDHVLPLGEITPSIAPVIHDKRKGVDVTPKEITLPRDGPFFHARNGLAVVYFGRDMDGRLRAFTYPGVNPYDRSLLLEPGEPIRREWYAQRSAEERVQEDARVAAAAEAAEQRQAEELKRERSAEVERRRVATLPYHSPLERQPLEALLVRAPMEPDNGELHYAIGMLLKESGDMAGAVRSFRTAASSGMKHARQRLAEIEEAR